MIDLKAARANPDAARAALARKGAGEAFDRLLEADERWRALVPRVDELRGRTKLSGKPTPEQREELQTVKAELKDVEEALTKAEAERDALALRVPNPPHDDVPDGSTEDDVREVRRVGEPPRFDDPREHLEIGRFDMERAARMSGARFGYWIGDTARLALALYRFALDRLAAEGFETVLPPVLVREQALIGTGAFPTDEANVYELPADDLYLAGTAEIPLASLHAGEILAADELPLRYVAFSPCFRREAGAAGRDTRGMIRVHQFNKVEQFSLTRPDDVVGRARAPAREHGGARRRARPALPRRRAPGGRHLERLGEDVRRGDLVPEPGPLSRDRLDLEHDGLPVEAPRDPHAGRGRPRARAHAERHRGRRSHGAGRPGELPGRRARRPPALRCARPDRVLASIEGPSKGAGQFGGRKSPFRVGRATRPLLESGTCGTRGKCAFPGTGQS